MDVEMLFKEYKKIVNGKEGEGYLEWQEEVFKFLEKYKTYNKMFNLKKRYEILLNEQKIKSRNNSFIHLVEYIIGICGPLIGALVAFLGMVQNAQISVRTVLANTVKTDDEKMQAIDLIIEAGKDLIENMNVILYIPIILIFYYLIFFLIEKFEDRRRCTKMFFYENILQIIDEEIEKMKQDK